MELLASMRLASACHAVALLALARVHPAAIAAPGWEDEDPADRARPDAGPAPPADGAPEDAAPVEAGDVVGRAGGAGMGRGPRGEL